MNSTHTIMATNAPATGRLVCWFLFHLKDSAHLNNTEYMAL